MQDLCERQYFADMARFPRLSDEDVRLLSQQIVTASQQHDTQAETAARRLLIEGLLPDVLPTAYRYAPRMQHFQLLDLVQEGNYGLVLAVHRFDFADTSRTFGSYALTYIRGKMKYNLHTDTGITIPCVSFYRRRTQGNLDEFLTARPASLDMSYYQTSHGDENLLHETIAAPPLYLLSSCTPVEHINTPKHQYVESLLATLPAQEQQVLRLRYGLDEHDGRTLDRDDIARLLGPSCPQVRNIEVRALGLLRRRGEGKPPRPHFNNDPVTTQARCESAYAQMVAQGVCLSVPRLKAIAHVGTKAARQFLRSKGVPPATTGRPRSQSQWTTEAGQQTGSSQMQRQEEPMISVQTMPDRQARLEMAYRYLQAQGRGFGVSHLLRHAHVSYKHALTFMQMKRQQQQSQTLTAVS